MIRALAFALALMPGSVAAEVPEPAGFREDDYRAPVPSTLEGGTVVSSEEAHALWREGKTAFIDVLPRAPKPEKLPEGTIWHERPRQSIPGSLWLPNVGYGRIADAADAYFRAGLSRATNGDPSHPILIFCLEDCWMSWNAAKRALGYGYETVYWYPEGTDGWASMEYPLEELAPEPW